MNNRDRYEAIGMLRNMSVNDVAAHFNVHRSTIFRVKQKLNQTGDLCSWTYAFSKPTQQPDAVHAR